MPPVGLGSRVRAQGTQQPQTQLLLRMFVRMLVFVSMRVLARLFVRVLVFLRMCDYVCLCLSSCSCACVIAYVVRVFTFVRMCDSIFVRMLVLVRVFDCGLARNKVLTQHLRNEILNDAVVYM